MAEQGKRRTMVSDGISQSFLGLGNVQSADNNNKTKVSDFILLEET